MGLLNKIFGSENKKQVLRVTHGMENSNTSSKASITKDPVCNMDVDKNTAAAKSEYRGNTYYFCAAGCKIQFDKDPERFLNGQPQNGHSHGHCC